MIHLVFLEITNFWAELGAWEVLYFFGLEEIVYSFFNFFLDTFWNSIYLTMYHSLGQRIWFMVMLYPLKESCILFQIRIFPVKLSYILSQFLLSWAQLWKYTPTVLMDNCDQPICLGLSILIIPQPMRSGFLKSLFLS